MKRRLVAHATLVLLAVSSPSASVIELMEVVTESEAVVFVPSITEGQEERAIAEDWQLLVDTLAVLESGTPEEKRFAASSLMEVDPFWVLDIPPDGDPATTERMVERIRAYVASEEDLWVLDRVALSLAQAVIGEATPIFADLLHNKAPSVRFRAIEHLTLLEPDEGIELLEPLWRADHPPWLRAELINALTVLEATIHVEDCTDLLDDPDNEVASAAIDCVAYSPDPDSSLDLARLAAKGTGVRRLEALEALPYMFDDIPDFDVEELRTALESMWRRGPEPWLQAELLRALAKVHSQLAAEIVAERIHDDDHPELVLAAIQLLNWHDFPESSQLLIERSAKGAPDLRAAAIEGLAAQPFTSDLERALLVATDPIEPLEVRLAAIEALEEHGHAGARGLILLGWDGADDRASRFTRWLEGLALSDADPLVGEAARASAERLRQDRQVFTIACGLSDVPPSFTLEGLGVATSLRCHDEPGVEPDPASAIRVVTGTHVHQTDRFDDGRSAWGATGLDDGRTCWVPLDRFRRIDPWETIEDIATESPDEFDLPLDETRTEAFRTLEDARLVTVFDIGENLAGVRLTVDPEDAQELELLRVATADASTFLARALARRLPPELYRDERTMGEAGLTTLPLMSTPSRASPRWVSP